MKIGIILIVLCFCILDPGKENCMAGVIAHGPQVTWANTKAAGKTGAGWSIISGQVVYSPFVDLMNQPVGYLAGKVSAIVAASESAGAKATKVISVMSLAIPGMQLAQLGRIALEAGLMWGAIEMGEWAAHHGMEWIDGILKKPSTEWQLDMQTAPPTPLPCINTTSTKFFPFPDLAANACKASNGGNDCDFQGVWNCTRNTLWAHYYHPSGGDCELGYNCYKQFAYYPNHPEYVKMGELLPATAEEIETAMRNGLNANENITGNILDKALGQLGKALNYGNAGWPNQTNGYPGLNSTQAQTVQNIYNNTVTNEQKTEIINQGDYQIANNITITDQPGVVNGQEQPKGITKQEVIEAINEAGAGAGDIVPLTPESEPEVPAETPIPVYLTEFWNAIRSLPIVSLLTNVSLSASGGSPVVNFTIPHLFVSGSTQIEMNFNNDGIIGLNYGYFLSLIGNVLLAFCGIRWIMYLFSSGE